MPGDDAIWDEPGRLTLDRDRAGPGVDLPPLEDESDGPVGPLRSILRIYLQAPPSVRSRYSLRLDNGQTYNEQDIAELLERADCPVGA